MNRCTHCPACLDGLPAVRDARELLADAPGLLAGLLDTAEASDNPALAAAVAGHVARQARALNEIEATLSEVLAELAR